jgi:hypothetical protein
MGRAKKRFVIASKRAKATTTKLGRLNARPRLALVVVAALVASPIKVNSIIKSCTVGTDKWLMFNYVAECFFRSFCHLQRCQC